MSQWFTLTRASDGQKLIVNLAKADVITPHASGSLISFSDGEHLQVLEHLDTDDDGGLVAGRPGREPVWYLRRSNETK